MATEIGGEGNGNPSRTGRLIRSVRTTQGVITTLLVLGILYTLYFVAGFLVPIVAASLLYLLFSPLTRLGVRRGIPEGVTAALILCGLLALFLLAFYALSGPVSNWMARAPQIAIELQDKLDELKKPVETAQKVQEQVEKATAVDGGGKQPQEVVVKGPGVLERLFESLRLVGTQLAVTFVLLFFLLASGEMMNEKLVRVSPSFRDKKRAVAIWRQVEREVSNYLFSITLINIGFGVVVGAGAGLYIVGMPNAVLWGAMAILLNYIPYLGAIIGIAILGIIGIVTYDDLSYAALAPAVYAVANIVESQFVTLGILGRRLTMNPVIIFLSVAFWAWIWGVPGALMAVPILVVVKVLCDHIESLAGLGEALSGRGSAPRINDAGPEDAS
jgi:predicted PurR-regulated permease PerM